jgi:hypothetical protein
VVERRQRADLAPARLLKFDPKDWTASVSDPHWGLWQRWVHARKTWCEAHPDSIALGNALERLKFEMETAIPGSTGHPRRGRKEG